MTSPLRRCRNFQASQASEADDITTLYLHNQVQSLSIFGPQVDTLFALEGWNAQPYYINSGSYLVFILPSLQHWDFQYLPMPTTHICSRYQLRCT